VHNSPEPRIVRLRVHAPASYAGLKHIFDAYQRFARRTKLPDAARHDMYVAIEEIVSNVIRHGITPGLRPRITVALRLDSRTFRATVADTGVAFDPLAAPLPDVTRPIEEQRVGGLGILLVRRLMDDVRYRRSFERNHVRLRTAVEGSAADGGSGLNRGEDRAW
jgi:anti-sigma regulatory factor (Ser/Thr protein kinase)